MKKIILIAIILVSSLSTTIVNAQKFAHVNAQELLLQLPERKFAEEELKKKAQELEDDLKRMKTKYEQMVKEYEELKKDPKTPESILKSRENDIIEYQQRIYQFQEIADEMLQKKENELMEPMIKKVREAINKVAKAQGINYVLDVSQLMYYDGGTDLQAAVKKELGIQ